MEATLSRAQRAAHIGHNRLLGALKGSIGMKTGYIRAAGYNIVNLVERGDKRLIVVVMGGRTAKARDAQVRRLLKTSLPRAARHRSAWCGQRQSLPKSGCASAPTDKLPKASGP